MKPTTLIAGLLVAGLAGAALAQPPGGVFSLPPKERHAATDKNKDGKVTKDEFVAVIEPDAQPFIDAIWANRDNDGDGWLTEAELSANGGGRAAPGGRGGAAAALAGRGGAAAGRAAPAAPAPK